MSSLRTALALYSRGLSVIPVPRPRPGVPAGQPGDGKTPAIKWKPYQTERADEAQIRQWFATEQNLAIVTGAISGIVVVDCDSDEAAAWAREHLDPTPWQVQTAKGWHLYFRRHPFGEVRNRARIHIPDGRLALDVRGDHGYVIGPGSWHASGARYVAVGDWTVPEARLPVFCEAWLARPERTDDEPPVCPGRPRPSGPALDRARRYLASIPRPEIGHGSDADTLRAACKLVRGFALPEAEAVDLLDEWAGGRPGWTRPWLATKVRNALTYGSEPIGGLL